MSISRDWSGGAAGPFRRGGRLRPPASLKGDWIIPRAFYSTRRSIALLDRTPRKALMLLRLALRQVSPLLIVLCALLVLTGCGGSATPQLVAPPTTILGLATPTASPTPAATSTAVRPTSTSALVVAATPVPTVV